MSVADAVRVEAHERVPADHWCVTRKDLKILRRQVKEAIVDGTVHPTKRDPFDLKDDVIGPNVYTVTEQFVKPLTAKAGGVSWALLQHPDGLKCDLFVTHAWAEGTFEIIDKVLASWPRRANNAWICFLANPQNSNIAALVSKPRASPFALALQSATHMMVVPNATCSIYSRLWCAYEAFLAYEWDKFIFMATHDVGPHCWKAIQMSLLCALAGGAIGHFWWWPIPASTTAHLVVKWSCIMLSLIIAVLAHGMSDRRRWLCDLAGSFLAGHVLAVHTFTRDRQDLHNVLAIIFSMMVVYHVATEKDRVKSAALQVATEELARDYTGSITDAHCSVAADEQAIRAEIATSTEEVNKTIQVLLRVGMSTPALRKAADLGVDMSGLAAKETSFTTTYVFGGIVIHAYQAVYARDLLRVLSFIVLACLGTFLLLISLVGHDRRVFAARLVELTAVLMVLPGTLMFMCFWDYMKALTLGAGLSVLQWLLCLSLPLAGVEKVAAIPGCGLWLAQLMAGYAPRKGHAGADGAWKWLQRAASFHQLLKWKATTAGPRPMGSDVEVGGS